MALSNIGTTSTTNLTNSSSTSSSASVTGSQQEIAGNFQQFLQLLTVQMQHQNPMEPMNSSEFNQQLTQYAGIEQQLKTNKLLETMVSANRATTISNAQNFVGTTITADGKTTPLKDGAALWQLNSPKAGTASLVIKDKNGNEVYSATRAMTAGQQDFSWNGVNSNGQRVSDGDYTITVSAKDTSGQIMSVSTEIAGVVDSADVSGDSPILHIGSLNIAMDSIKSIRR